MFRRSFLSSHDRRVPRCGDGAPPGVEMTCSNLSQAASGENGRENLKNVEHLEH